MEEFKKIKSVLQEQDKLLRQLEQDYGLSTPAETFAPIKNNEVIIIPEIGDLNFSNWQTITEEWPAMEYDLLPRWRTADIPVMLLAGIIGGLVSNKLLERFAKLHDHKWMQHPFEEGGHARELIDQTRGYIHRFRYGHDLVNPFEVDWDNYLPVGSPNTLLIKKVGLWLRHLFQDSFSTEGLPLPGSSYFRDQLLNGVEDIANTRNPIYQTFFTLKMRDFSAAGFVSGVMTLYVFGTEMGQERKFFNYRYVSLTIGALIVSIVSGLLMTPPSFNHVAFAALVPYVVTLFKVNQRINAALQQREQVIQNNQAVLQAQRKHVTNAYQEILEMDIKINAVYNQLMVISQNNWLLLEKDLNECKRLLEEEAEYLDHFEMKIRKEFA